MKTTIKIQDQTIEVASNAFTPLLYRQIFKKDFLKEITSMRGLIGKKKEELSDEDLGLATERSDIFSKLAFCMAKQAELVEAAELVNLTLIDYYNWLMNFDANAFTTAQTLGSIINAWKGNANDSHVEAKNEGSRESET